MADAAVEDKEAFLTTVRDRYKRCIESDKDNRDRAKEALAFRNLEQWDEKIKNERMNDLEGARPCLVVDKLNQHVHQVVNDERQNRPQIKVRPVDDGGDVEVAKIYDGIIRHIQDRSHADIAYDTGFECAVDGGFGFWRLLTEYCDPMSMDQDIRIKRLRNRFAVYLDPERQEPDGSDANYGFILYKVPKEEFKGEFGKDGEEALGSFEHEGKEFTLWYGTDWVIYAEYFWKDKKKEKIVMLADAQGTVMLKSEYEKTKNTTKIQKERATELVTIRWRKLTATKILDDGEVVFDHIPIVEVVGNELDIEGKVVRSGMIRPAMDAQRVDNYSTSAFIENVALAPRAPIQAAAGQIEGYEELWRTANRRNISVLPYKPITVEGIIVPPPQRMPSPGISQGWLAVMEQSEHNIQAAMGRYNATLGAPSNETSGKAINARGREGDVGSFHYSDNLARSMRHTGQMIVTAIPKVYDTKRVARIIGEDGEPGTANVDPDLADANGKPIPYQERQGQDGKIEKIYNLGVGKYDVTVITGPSYTTRRLESADAMMEISRGNTEFLSQFGDIIFKAQDWPGADQIASRFKKMLPPGLAGDEDDEPEPIIQTPQGPLPASQASQMMQSMAQQLEQAGEALKKAGDLQKIEQGVKDEAAKVDAEVARLEAIRADIAAAERELTLQTQLAEAQLEKQALEASCQQRDAHEAQMNEVRTTVETAKGEQEAQQAKPQPAQPVNVIDSSVAAPLSEVAQSTQMVAQAIAQQSQAIADLAAATRAPRRNRMVLDGETIESTSEAV